MTDQFAKCSGCRCLRNINTEFEIYKGKRRKTCLKCKANRKKKKKKCPHEKSEYHCKECNGKGICKHKKFEYYCKECNGKGICKHEKQKYRCKKCGDVIKITIRNWIYNSKSKDKKYNRYDANNFIDKCFLEGLVEDCDNKCHYCHIEIQFIDKDKDLASIERLDNSIGHTKRTVLLLV